MPQTEGTQPNLSFESPIKESEKLEELPYNHANIQNFESLPGCAQNQNNTDLSSVNTTLSTPQQPETLNLPAVLWDKPAGSKIRVPPPVPPRSPRKPMDPVESGAFEEAMKSSFCADPSQENIAPQRGLPLNVTVVKLTKPDLFDFFVSHMDIKDKSWFLSYEFFSFEHVVLMLQV